MTSRARSIHFILACILAFACAVPVAAQEPDGSEPERSPLPWWQKQSQERTSTPWWEKQSQERSPDPWWVQPVAEGGTEVEPAGTSTQAAVAIQPEADPDPPQPWWVQPSADAEPEAETADASAQADPASRPAAEIETEPAAQPETPQPTAGVEWIPIGAAGLGTDTPEMVWVKMPADADATYWTDAELAAIAAEDPASVRYEALDPDLAAAMQEAAAADPAALMAELHEDLRTEIEDIALELAATAGVPLTREQLWAPPPPTATELAAEVAEGMDGDIPQANYYLHRTAGRDRRAALEGLMLRETEDGSHAVLGYETNAATTHAEMVSEGSAATVPALLVDPRPEADTRFGNTLDINRHGGKWGAHLSAPQLSLLESQARAILTTPDGQAPTAAQIAALVEPVVAKCRQDSFDSAFGTTVAYIEAVSSSAAVQAAPEVSTKCIVEALAQPPPDTGLPPGLYRGKATACDGRVQFQATSPVSQEAAARRAREMAAEATCDDLYDPTSPPPAPPPPVVDDTPTIPPAPQPDPEPTTYSAIATACNGTKRFTRTSTVSQADATRRASAAAAAASCPSAPPPVIENRPAPPPAPRPEPEPDPGPKPEATTYSATATACGGTKRFTRTSTVSQADATRRASAAAAAATCPSTKRPEPPPPPRTYTRYATDCKGRRHTGTGTSSSRARAAAQRSADRVTCVPVDDDDPPVIVINRPDVDRTPTVVPPTPTCENGGLTGAACQKLCPDNSVVPKGHNCPIKYVTRRAKDCSGATHSASDRDPDIAQRAADRKAAAVKCTTYADCKGNVHSTKNARDSANARYGNCRSRPTPDNPLDPYEIRDGNLDSSEYDFDDYDGGMPDLVDPLRGYGDPLNQPVPSGRGLESIPNDILDKKMREEEQDSRAPPRGPATRKPTTYSATATACGGTKRFTRTSTVSRGLAQLAADRAARAATCPAPSKPKPTITIIRPAKTDPRPPRDACSSVPSGFYMPGC